MSRDRWGGGKMPPPVEPVDGQLELAVAPATAPVAPSPTLDDRIADAERIIREALDVHLGGRELVGRVVLFSGGGDSTVLAHLARHVLPVDLRATHAGHANTTIGVEATRQFVRDTCTEWGLPLLEKLPPVSYAELVRGSGFPGAAMHFRMYQRLKERGLRQIRADLVTYSRRERVLFLAGRRRAESARRLNVPEYEREGSVVWASPLAHWTADDLAAYRTRYEVPRNPVSEALGMSGECLCGAFAEPGELDRIKAVDLAAYEQIRALEAEVHGKFPEHRCHWGWHGWHDERRELPSRTGPLCSSCDARSGPLVERLPEDPRLDAVVARSRARRAARTAQGQLELEATS